MNKGLKIWGIIGAIAGVLIIGAALGWWKSRTPKPVSDVGAPQTNTGLTTVVKTDTNPPVKKSARKEYVRIRRANAKSPQTSANSTNVTQEWEDKVDAIITTESGNDSDKAKQLLQLFPTLPEDGKEEVAQHLSNLVSDEDYAASGLGKLLTDASLPEPVLDVLMADILNRPNAVKLPTLLEVAQNPQHPGKDEAKDLLELFLDPDEDYGTDWTKWQTKMDQWLKDNPD